MKVSNFFIIESIGFDNFDTIDKTTRKASFGNDFVIEAAVLERIEES
jgi:hypothetical protein